MGLLFPLLLAYVNGVRAARKGHSTLLWAFISFVAFMITAVAGSMLLLACFYKGNPLDPRAVTAFFSEGTLRSVTVLMAGIGGFLAVRFAIDRLVARNKDERQDSGMMP